MPDIHQKRSLLARSFKKLSCRNDQQPFPPGQLKESGIRMVDFCLWSSDENLGATQTCWWDVHPWELRVPSTHYYCSVQWCFCVFFSWIPIQLQPWHKLAQYCLWATEQQVFQNRNAPPCLFSRQCVLNIMHTCMNPWQPVLLKGKVQVHVGIIFHTIHKQCFAPLGCRVVWKTCVDTLAEHEVHPPWHISSYQELLTGSMRTHAYTAPPSTLALLPDRLHLEKVAVTLSCQTQIQNQLCSKHFTRGAANSLVPSTLSHNSIHGHFPK